MLESLIPIIAVIAFSGVICAMFASQHRIGGSPPSGNDMARLFIAKRDEYTSGGWKAVVFARVLMATAIALIVVAFVRG